MTSHPKLPAFICLFVQVARRLVTDHKQRVLIRDRDGIIDLVRAQHGDLFEYESVPSHRAKRAAALGDGADLHEIETTPQCQVPADVRFRGKRARPPDGKQSCKTRS